MTSPGMMKIFMILVDTNGDGALSLDEVQAVHARIFKAIDENGDGQATPEEFQTFFASMHR